MPQVALKGAIDQCFRAVYRTSSAACYSSLFQTFNVWLESLGRFTA